MLSRIHAGKSVLGVNTIGNGNINCVHIRAFCHFVYRRISCSSAIFVAENLCLVNVSRAYGSKFKTFVEHSPFQKPIGNGIGSRNAKSYFPVAHYGSEKLFICIPFDRLCRKNRHKRFRWHSSALANREQ